MKALPEFMIISGLSSQAISVLHLMFCSTKKVLCLALSYDVISRFLTTVTAEIISDDGKVTVSNLKNGSHYCSSTQPSQIRSKIFVINIIVSVLLSVQDSLLQSAAQSAASLYGTHYGRGYKPYISRFTFTPKPILWHFERLTSSLPQGLL